MRTITVNNKEYTLEFTYSAAECKDLVQKMFNVISGAYIYKNNNSKDNVGSLFDGVADMVSEIPHICNTAFYGGLLENHNGISFEDARQILRGWMKENKYSYNKAFEEIKLMMEEDGFFEIAGLTEMLQKMNEPTVKKVPTDHKKKSIGKK